MGWTETDDQKRAQALECASRLLAGLALAGTPSVDEVMTATVRMARVFKKYLDTGLRVEDM